MRVRFSLPVMSDKGSWRTLDRMVMLFEDGRHDWLADNPEEIESSPWLQDGGRAGEANLKVLQEHIRMAAYPKPRIEITILLATASQTALSVIDGLRAMETPLFVLMENATADGGFFETLVDTLNRVELRNATQKGWLHIVQMGGFGEVEKMIDHLRRDIPGPSRMFVLADSDAQFPGEETATCLKVTKSCIAAGVAYAILRKRKIENYIPVSVLNRLGSRRATGVFQAFLHLNGDQRSYYEMKGGFAKDERGSPIIPPAQTALFAGVRGPVLRDLCSGFGPDVATCFVSDRAKITAGDIRQVCDSDPTELHRILDQIEGLL